MIKLSGLKDYTLAIAPNCTTTIATGLQKTLHIVFLTITSDSVSNCLKQPPDADSRHLEFFILIYT